MKSPFLYLKLKQHTPMQNATKLIMTLLAYFSPISSLVHIVLVLISIDFLTGIYASIRTKDTIVSHRLRKTLEKFVFYTISIMVAHMFQIEILTWVNLSQFVAGYIASVELLSIYENITKITGLKIASKVKDLIKDNLSKLISKNKTKDTNEDSNPEQPSI